jgi:hypothetical protein
MGWNGPRSLASKCHKSVVGERHNCEEPSARHSATIGLDLAKPWFRQARGPSPSGVRPGDLRAPARSRDILYRGAPSVNGIISHTRQAPRFFLTLAGLLPACVAGTENHPANIRSLVWSGSLGATARAAGKSPAALGGTRAAGPDTSSAPTG